MDFQKAKLEAVMDEVLAKPKNAEDDVIRLLSAFIKRMLPVKIEPKEEIQPEIEVTVEKEANPEEEKLESHAEEVALASPKSPTQLKNLSLSVEEHSSHKISKTHRKNPLKSRSMKSRRVRRSVQKLMTNEKDIIRVSHNKLKKKIEIHKKLQGRRKGVWVCVLDDRELMKFKSN
jgi:hypothetical protein